MWIKICGNTNLEDARLAADSGADAVGFVFAPSPRQVTVAQVGRITPGLPSALETYGVFVGASLTEIVAAVEAGGLSGVQLHRSADQGLPSRLREHFRGRGQRLKILQVLAWGRGEASRNTAAQSAHASADFERQLAECAKDDAVDGVLVDSSTAAAVGGTGTSFAWEAARASFLTVAPHTRLIVAGGLRPENVKQAISTLLPWGVDVVSGVEAAPGKKDGARVRAFIRAAREAAAEWGDGAAANAAALRLDEEERQ